MDKIINSLEETIEKLKQPISGSPPYLKNRIKEIEDVIQELKNKPVLTESRPGVKVYRDSISHPINRIYEQVRREA